MTKDQPTKRNKKGWATTIAAFALGAILALAGFSFTSTSATSNSDVVVTVNGRDITKDEFFERLEQEAGEQVLDLLITELLIEQAQQTRDITVTEEEVANEINMIAASYPSEAAFSEALDRFGISLERLRHEILLNLVVHKLSLRGVEVTDEEIETFFEENKALLDRPEAALVAHILVDTKDEADEILKELNGGADFADLARTRSLDTASAAQGGSIGYIEPDSPITEPFKQAAFALNQGETSAPINTEFGWHIVRVHERIEAEDATLESSADQVREILLREKTRSIDEILEDLHRDATIDVQWSRYSFFQTTP